jgi:hypothetical protein
LTDKAKLYVDQEQTFQVGQDTFIDSTSENNLAVIFEDNVETGYFYAIDRNNNQEILDALHIYNVADVKDKHKPSVVKIIWTEDSTRAFLVINDYCHAVFDFKNKGGYCRNAFPENKNGWTNISDRKLTDSLLETLLSADT